MPFPLAHPAAVLPLRRLCPKYLNFAALVIGSLTPDLGYAFGRLKVAGFSHLFPMGIIGFTLPVGLLILVLLHFVSRFPAFRFPLSRWPSARTFRFISAFPDFSLSRFPLFLISLFIGATTHLLLDSLTHPDGYLVEHLSLLRLPVMTVRHYHLRVCDVLYGFFTFAGVTWLALAYLDWLQTTQNNPTTPAAAALASTRQSAAAGPTTADTDRHSPLVTRIANWSCATLLGLAILFLATATRGQDRLSTLLAVGTVSAVLVGLFIIVTAKQAKQQNPTQR